MATNPHFSLVWVPWSSFRNQSNCSHRIPGFKSELYHEPHSLATSLAHYICYFFVTNTHTMRFSWDCLISLKYSILFSFVFPFSGFHKKATSVIWFLVDPSVSSALRRAERILQPNGFWITTGGKKWFCSLPKLASSLMGCIVSTYNIVK